MKLVRVIIDQAPDDWRAAAFLLERSYADEYSRVSVERVEQIGEKADERPLTILYDTGGQKLEELLSFPIHPSMNLPMSVCHPPFYFVVSRSRLAVAELVPR